MGRKDVGAASRILLENVVLDGTPEILPVHALLLRVDEIEREEDGGGRVDGHRRGHLRQRNAVEEASNIVDRVDGYSHFSHLSVRHRMVGVVADLRWQVEGNGETGLPLIEEEAVTLVRLVRITVAGVLAHGPHSASVHLRIEAPRIGKRSGIADALAIGSVR